MAAVALAAPDDPDDEFTELADANIGRVDLVRRSANGHRFLLAKARENTMTTQQLHVHVHADRRTPMAKAGPPPPADLGQATIEQLTEQAGSGSPDQQAAALQEIGRRAVAGVLAQPTPAGRQAAAPDQAVASLAKQMRSRPGVRSDAEAVILAHAELRVRQARAAGLGDSAVAVATAQAVQDAAAQILKHRARRGR